MLKHILSCFRFFFLEKCVKVSKLFTVAEGLFLVAVCCPVLFLFVPCCLGCFDIVFSFCRVNWVVFGYTKLFHFSS